MPTLPKPNDGAPEKAPRQTDLSHAVVFETGATRNAGVTGDYGTIPLRYDLLLDNVHALQRLARTFGEGSLKYPARNWMKGIPESSLLNHAMAHIVAHMKGDTSEDHLAHAVWNLSTLMWVQDERPDLLDVTGKAANPVLGNERNTMVAV